MIVIALLRETTDPRITTELLSRFADAFALKNACDFVPVWGSENAISLVVLEKNVTLPAGVWPCHVVDAIPDAPGALAYHDEEGDISALWAEAQDALALTKEGAAKLSQATLDMLSTAIDHEICEALINRFVNEWVDVPQGARIGDAHHYGFQTPKETCDAVEGNSYPITTSDGGVVAVTNFLKPLWFDAEAGGTQGVPVAIGGTVAPYDMLGVLSAPFSLAPGGYVSLRDSEGNFSTQWGELVKESKKAAVLRRGRIARYQRPRIT